MAPQYQSAAEINERLVMESLAWKAKHSGLVLHDGTITNLLWSKEHVAVWDKVKHLCTGRLCAAARDTLFKEFPDDQGADAVALVQPSSWCPQAGGGSPACILLRVQVKMSSGSERRVRGGEAEEWLSKLASGSTSLTTLLQGEDSVGCAEARHIMWCAQPLTAPAAKLFNDTTRCSLHVSQENMLGFWSPRIRAFVDAEKLTQYGYKHL